MAERPVLSLSPEAASKKLILLAIVRHAPPNKPTTADPASRHVPALVVDRIVRTISNGSSS
jgi:hypothetical protein